MFVAVIGAYPFLLIERRELFLKVAHQLQECDNQREKIIKQSHESFLAAKWFSDTAAIKTNYQTAETIFGNHELEVGGSLKNELQRQHKFFKDLMGELYAVVLPQSKPEANTDYDQLMNGLDDIQRQVRKAISIDSHLSEASGMVINLRNAAKDTWDRVFSDIEGVLGLKLDTNRFKHQYTEVSHGLDLVMRAEYYYQFVLWEAIVRIHTSTLWTMQKYPRLCGTPTPDLNLHLNASSLHFRQLNNKSLWRQVAGLEDDAAHEYQKHGAAEKVVARHGNGVASHFFVNPQSGVGWDNNWRYGTGGKGAAPRIFDADSFLRIRWAELLEEHPEHLLLKCMSQQRKCRYCYVLGNHHETSICISQHSGLSCVCCNMKGIVCEIVSPTPRSLTDLSRRDVPKVLSFKNLWTYITNRSEDNEKYLASEVWKLRVNCLRCVFDPERPSKNLRENCTSQRDLKDIDTPRMKLLPACERCEIKRNIEGPLTTRCLIIWKDKSLKVSTEFHLVELLWRYEARDKSTSLRPVMHRIPLYDDSGQTIAQVLRKGHLVEKLPEAKLICSILVNTEIYRQRGDSDPHSTRRRSASPDCGPTNKSRINVRKSGNSGRLLKDSPEEEHGTRTGRNSIPEVRNVSPEIFREAHLRNGNIPVGRRVSGPVRQLIVSPDKPRRVTLSVIPQKRNRGVQENTRPFKVPGILMDDTGINGAPHRRLVRPSS